MVRVTPRLTNASPPALSTCCDDGVESSSLALAVITTTMSGSPQTERAPDRPVRGSKAGWGG